jgi:hypothetical protein
MLPATRRPFRTARLILALAILVLGLLPPGALLRPQGAAAAELGLQLPEKLDFGRLRAGEERTLALPVRNGGAAPIWIEAAGMSDRSINGGQLGLNWDVRPWRARGCGNQWLQPGATCTMEIRVFGIHNGRHTGAVKLYYFSRKPIDREEVSSSPAA